MPVLQNPRHEAFAQAIFSGLLNSSRETFSKGRAYQRAGYLAKDAGVKGGSAEVCAGKLLKKVQPIMARVRELQAELAKDTKETREKIIAELNELNTKAQAKDAYGPAVSAVMGKAKVLNLITDRVEDVTKIDFNSAQSIQDIGRKLLQSVGFSEPDDVSIEAAIEANDAFIERLEAIRNAAQGHTLEQDEN
jgi:hypothetical protein